ncbi:MAG TPA: hypothetical protein VI072_19820 [Polyangiaceae bacterium]
MEEREYVGVGLDQSANAGKGEVERLKGVDAVRVMDRIIGQSDDLIWTAKVTAWQGIRFRRADGHTRDPLGWAPEMKFALSNRREWLVVHDVRSLCSIPNCKSPTVHIQLSKHLSSYLRATTSAVGSGGSVHENFNSCVVSGGAMPDGNPVSPSRFPANRSPTNVSMISMKPIDMRIELDEFVSGDPELFVRATTRALHGIPRGKRRLEPKPRNKADEARELIVCVPVPGDLAGILERKHWIEDGLIRQSRRPGAPPGCRYESQFLQSEWAV